MPTPRPSPRRWGVSLSRDQGPQARREAVGIRGEAIGMRGWGPRTRSMHDKITSYKDLVTWQKSRELVKHVYEATRAFPAEERFGLTAQAHRASVSIPSNIAEGYGRGTRQNYLRHLRIARGSVYELETQLLLCQDVGLLSDQLAGRLIERADECSRVLNGLMVAVELSLPCEN